ncbi:hypothetical protein BGZ63DRAFT_383891, partial [Mariannaea sp. PMI_226]
MNHIQNHDSKSALQNKFFVNDSAKNHGSSHRSTTSALPSLPRYGARFPENMN